MHADEVLKFWFGRDRKAWFEKNPAFDEDIRARFLPHYELGAAGMLGAWKQAPASCLALVVLLDQFPRNMFRDSARAFAADPLARDAARTILDRGWDQAMTPDERMFAYLPFEHSEALQDQELSLQTLRGQCQLRVGAQALGNHPALRTVPPPQCRPRARKHVRRNRIPQAARLKFLSR